MTSSFHHEADFKDEGTVEMGSTNFATGEFEPARPFDPSPMLYPLSYPPCPEEEGTKRQKKIEIEDSEAGEDQRKKKKKVVVVVVVVLGLNVFFPHEGDFTDGGTEERGRTNFAPGGLEPTTS